MPKITTTKKLFYSLLGSKPNSDELEQKLTCAKAELDGEDDHTLSSIFNV